jgi:hypothetical protein
MARCENTKKNKKFPGPPFTAWSLVTRKTSCPSTMILAAKITRSIARIPRYCEVAMDEAVAEASDDVGEEL